ncbi:hypothetical protein ACFSHQ_17270 [Gemmobacter lanyuensis]
MAARPRLVPLPEPAARAPRLALVAPVAETAAPAETLALGLLRDGVVQPDDLLQALALRAEQGGSLTEILLRRGLIAEPVLRRALARHWDLEEADLAARAPTRVCSTSSGPRAACGTGWSLGRRSGIWCWSPPPGPRIFFASVLHLRRSLAACPRY